MPPSTRSSTRNGQTIVRESNGTPSARAAFSNRKAPDTGNAHAKSGSATPPSSNQDDQMRQVVPPTPTSLDLHHSPDNHEPSHHDLTLQFPSGATERFAFGKRTQKRSHRYARPLSPIEDLIRTIEVLNSSSNTKAELHIMRNIVQTAYNSRDQLSAAALPTLQNLISKYSQSNPLLPLSLSPPLIEHFFDQLHDRCISDLAHLLERPGSATRESTYGELTPSFVSTLILQTSLSKTETFLDLGSGVGQVCMQVSLETGCRSFGVEREGRTHAVGMVHLRQFWERVGLWGLMEKGKGCGRVYLKKGDFLAEGGFVEGLLEEADVVLVNNLKLEPRTDLELQGILKRGLKSGAKVVSTRSLVPVGRKRKRKRDIGMVADEVVRKGGKGRPRQVVVLPTPSNTPEPGVDVDEVLIEKRGEDEVWTWTQYVYAAGSVTWSDKRGLYFISIRK